MTKGRKHIPYKTGQILISMPKYDSKYKDLNGNRYKNKIKILKQTGDYHYTVANYYVDCDEICYISTNVNYKTIEKCFRIESISESLKRL